jgi:hypothetical protein
LYLLYTNILLYERFLEIEFVGPQALMIKIMTKGEILITSCQKHTAQRDRHITKPHKTHCVVKPCRHESMSFTQSKNERKSLNILMSFVFSVSHYSFQIVLFADEVKEMKKTFMYINDTKTMNSISRRVAFSKINDLFGMTLKKSQFDFDVDFNKK